MAKRGRPPKVKAENTKVISEHLTVDEVPAFMNARFPNANAFLSGYHHGNRPQNHLPANLKKMTNKQPICHSCHEISPDYHELAKHIMGAKTGHRKGKVWAAKYIMISGLSPKAKNENHERAPISEQDRENKIDSKRELSGEYSYVRVKCPRCNYISQRAIEVEYAQSNDALRDENGVLLIYCDNCGGRAR